MLIMSAIFRTFGSITKNYFIVFAFTNIVLVNAAVFYLYSLVRRVCGTKASYTVLTLLFLYIPMYFFPSMIYTDTATMFAPIGCLYLFYRAGEEGCGRRTRFACYVLIGVMSGIGFAVKPTAAIMYIAIVLINCVLTRKLEIYKLTAVSAVFFVLVTAFFQTAYRIHIPGDVRAAHSIPPTHWVMMGLQNDGRVSWSEYVATMSHPTYAGKHANAVAVIQARLGEMGAGGFLSLAARKTGVLYENVDFQPGGIIPFYKSDAAMRLRALTLDNPVIMVYNGIVFYGAAVLALLSIIFKNRNLTAYAAFIGVHLFFIFWEVNPKYLTNYFFVFIFLACLTVSAVFEQTRFARENRRNERSRAEME